jgi:hypothetical protein
MSFKIPLGNLFETNVHNASHYKSCCNDQWNKYVSAGYDIVHNITIGEESQIVFGKMSNMAKLVQWYNKITETGTGTGTGTGNSLVMYILLVDSEWVIYYKKNNREKKLHKLIINHDYFIIGKEKNVYRITTRKDS